MWSNTKTLNLKLMPVIAGHTHGAPGSQPPSPPPFTLPPSLW